MSETSGSTAILIDLPRGAGRQRFESVAELRKWWQEQIAFWKIMKLHEQAKAWDSVLELDIKMKEFIVSSEMTPTQFKSDRLQPLIDRSTIVYTPSPSASLVKSLEQREDIPASWRMTASAAALAYLSGFSVAATDTPAVIAGVAAARSFQVGESQETKSGAESLDALFNRAASQIEQLRQVPEGIQGLKEMISKDHKELAAQVDLSKRSLEVAFLEARSKLFNDVEAVRTSVVAETTRWSTEGKAKHDESLAAIERHQQALMAKFAAGKPIEYWNDRGTRCRKNAQWAFASFALLATIVAFALAWTFGYFADGITKLNSATQNPLGLAAPDQMKTLAIATTIAIAKSLVMVTLAFWLLRVVLRLALSNYHLAEDAAERVAMAQTYLALIAEGGATSDGDKKIVLEAMFRRGGTGIYREDAAPPAIAFLPKNTD